MPKLQQRCNSSCNCSRHPMLQAAKNARQTPIRRLLWSVYVSIRQRLLMLMQARASLITIARVSFRQLSIRLRMLSIRQRMLMKTRARPLSAIARV